jgi:hypothetical protein
VQSGGIQLAFMRPAAGMSSKGPAPATTRPGTAATKPGPAASTARPGTAIASTPTPAPEPVRPADPIGDQVRAKAGHPITFTPFEIRDGTKVLVLVDRDGKISARGRVTGVWQKSGVLEDARGKAVLAVAKNGDVWISERRAPAKRAKLESGRLVIDGGLTLTVLASGHAQLTRGKEVEVSTALLSPPGVAKQDLALLVSFLSISEMKFKKPAR